MYLWISTILKIQDGFIPFEMPIPSTNTCGKGKPICRGLSLGRQFLTRRLYSKNRLFRVDFQFRAKFQLFRRCRPCAHARNSAIPDAVSPFFPTRFVVAINQPRFRATRKRTNALLWETRATNRFPVPITWYLKKFNSKRCKICLDLVFRNETIYSVEKLYRFPLQLTLLETINTIPKNTTETTMWNTRLHYLITINYYTLIRQLTIEH